MERNQNYHARGNLELNRLHNCNPRESNFFDDLRFGKASLRSTFFSILLISLISFSGFGQSPGGVSSGLQLWLKANAGGGSNSWSDQAGGNDFNTKVGSGNITLEQTDQLNFNDVMRFPGNAALRPSAGVTGFPTGSASRLIFSVIRNAATASEEFIFQYGQTGGNWAAYGQFITSGNYGVDYGTSLNPNHFLTSISASDDPAVFMSHFSGSQEQVRINQGTAQTLSFSFLANNVAFPTVGASAGTIAQSHFNGDIAEVILYSGNPSSAEQQRIASYLALKYGITLDAGNTDYLASNGTSKMWDSSKTGVGAAFKNDVAGIGKDDGSALTQLKSTSQNSDAMLTIEASSGSVSNLEFLSWANDGGVVTETSCSGCGGITKTIGRRWLIQDIGDLGSLTVSFDVSGSGLSSKGLSDFKLVIDDDNDLTDGELTTISAASFNNDIVVFTGVSLDDGDYLALSTESPKLKFTVQPSNTTSVDDISPGVRVSIVNGSNTVLTDVNATINLFIENNVGSGTLDGTISKPTTSGEATFSDLSIDELGTGYTLRAEASGFDNTTSSTFNITVGPPAQFIIQQEPSNRAVGQVIFPAVTVALADANGNIRTAHTGFDIDVDFFVNPGGATLGGTLTQETENGIATFDDLEIDKIGTNYQLEFTALGVTAEQSTPFNITQVPGGVGADLQLWLKADSGVSGAVPITNWADQSGSGITSTISGNPSLETESMNFNPSVKFDPAGTSPNEDWIETSLSINADVYPELTVYAVYKPATDNSGGVWGEDDGGWDRFLVDNAARASSLDQAVSNGSGTASNIASIFPIEKPVITTVVFDEDQANGSFVYANFQEVRNFTSNHGSETSGNLFLGTIGIDNPSLDDFNGDISEIIVFSAIPTIQERQQIESYLAIKYGVTLDQTIPTDYLASNGIAVWDASANVGYVTDIAGIGEDPISGLSQNKSKSQNDGVILTIEHAGGTITDDHFMIWGNNGQSTTSTTNLTINGVNHDRIERVWRVQEKNNTEIGSTGVGTVADLGAVNLSFDMTGITYTSDRVRLLIDDDGTFGAGTVISTVVGAFNGDVVTFSNVNIADGDHITITTDFAPKLFFSVEPVSTLINADINDGTGIKVRLLDANDNVLSNSTATVILEIETDPTGSANLNGTNSVAAVAGEATFTGLQIDASGTGYVLRATSPVSGALQQSSAAFNINAAPAGIGTSLRYWLDANDLDGDGIAEGVATESGLTSGEINTWVNKGGDVDFTDNAIVVADVPVTTSPDLLENEFNFNPGVQFNPNSIKTDYLGANVTDFPTSDITQFLVLKSSGTGDGILSYYATSGSNNEFLVFAQQNITVYGAGSNSGSTGVNAAGGRPNLLTIDRTAIGTNNTNIYLNGQASSTKTTASGHSNESEGTLILGQEQDPGIDFSLGQDQFYQGMMAEMITYASILSVEDRQKVESYLSLKYGITLSNDGDGDSIPGESNGDFSEGDYLASNGVVVWDYSEFPSHVDDVAGIGRDDDSGLDQVKSKSENTGSIVTVASNSGTIVNGNFLIWGHNGATTTNSITATINGVSHSIMERIWRVQEKNFTNSGNNIGTDSDIGAVDVSFDLTGITYTAEKVRLIVLDGEGVASVSSVGGSFNGDVVTFTGVTDLEDGGFFSVSVDFTPKLVFTLEPNNTPRSTRINALDGIQVSVVDGADQVLTSSSITVDLTFENDASGGSATLSGTLSQMALSGVVTFQGVSIDIIGQAYTLEATSLGNASSAVSAAFNILGAPGGIGSDLRYWLDGADLDADGLVEGGSEDGLLSGEVQVWANKTGSNNLVRATSANFTPTAPDFLSSSLNFNPSVQFNPDALTDDLLGASIEDFPTDQITQFVILQHSSSGAKTPISYGVVGSTNEFTFFTAGDRFELYHNGSELEEANFVLPSDEVKLVATHLDAGSDLRIFENGKPGVDNMITPTALTGTGTIWLGQDQDTSIPGSRGSNNGNAFKGQIGEIVTYARKLSGAEHSKVQSYLALKYGITLDQSTATNYESSDGTIIWDATQKSIYSNDIAGIGRDDNSGLNQKQSQTTRSTGVVTIGLGDGMGVLPGSNAENSNSFAVDNSYLIWGNDNAVLDAPKDEPAYTQIPIELGVNSRLNRQWRVQETGTIGAVNIEFDLSSLPGLSGVGTNNESDLVLLVSNEPDFTSATATVATVGLSFETPGDGKASFRFDFTDGDYFTLGSSELGALPIKLISFASESKPDHVLLKWETSWEENNAFFRIERSLSDLNFESIGFVSGNGTHDGFIKYSFKDLKPHQGVNYYRLVDIDINGNESFSKVIRENFDWENQTDLDLLVYPNPVDSGEEVQIQFDFDQINEEAVFHLFDTEGKLLNSEHLEKSTSSGPLIVSTQGLSSGIYVLRFTTSKGRSEYQKLIVKERP